MFQVKGFLNVLLMKLSCSIGNESFQVEHVLNVGFDGKAQVVADETVKAEQELVSFEICYFVVFENGQHLACSMVSFDFLSLVFDIRVVEDGLMILNDFVDFLNIMIMWSKDNRFDFFRTYFAFLHKLAVLALHQLGI